MCTVNLYEKWTFIETATNFYFCMCYIVLVYFQENKNVLHLKIYLGVNPLPSHLLADDIFY